MSELPGQPRIAVVHEWLTEWGGSEDTLRQMLQCHPDAELYATIDYLKEADRAKLGTRAIRTTWLQRAPFVQKRFWNYLPVTGLAVESHDASAADIIVSSSHAFAKGVLTTANQLHVSYVYSPMRYAWDLHHEYLRDYRLDKGAKSLLARYMFHRLRAWDRQTANNVDLFVAISHHIRKRIWRTYRRPAAVIYPPVATQRFTVETAKEDHYVTVSRLVSYKRIDLMLQAFALMPARKLVVIGSGPELERLRQVCPPNVTMLGWQPDEVVQQHLRSARAFLFAAHEDFGIAPVEAQACGTPVIAYGVGGAVETVCDLGGDKPATGVLFARQTPEGLVEAVERFEQAGAVFDPHACRAWAERFSEERFRREYADCLEQAWSLWRKDGSQVESLLERPRLTAMDSDRLAAQAAPWPRLTPGVSVALVLLLALPWLWPFAPGPSSNVVPWLASLACALLAFLLAAPVRPQPRLLALVGAAVLWVALRSLTGVLDRAAFAGACVLVVLAFSTAAGAASGDEPAVEWIAWSWLLAALLSALLALVQYFDLAGGLQPWVYGGKAGDALANLRQRNQLASLTTIGLAALLWLAGRKPQRLPWWLAAVLLLAVANAATTSRTGLLQWLVVVGLCALWRGPERAQRLSLGAAGLLAYAAAIVLLPQLLERFTGATADTLFGRLGADFGCSSRRVLWGNVLQLVAQKPLAGWGWGELDYAHYLHLYGHTPRFCDILDNAHSLPLHVAVELGVPAALLLCGAVVWGILRAAPWRETEAHRQLAWCVLAVLAIHSLLEYPLWYGPFQIALGLALGLLVRPAAAARALAVKTRTGIVAFGLGLLAYAGWDYERVSQVYLEPDQRLAIWRENTLDAVRKSWLFSGQARFAELTLSTLDRANLPWTDVTAQAMLHYSPEPRIIERVIESATMAGRYDEAVLHLARYRAAFPEDYAKWRAAQKAPLPAL